MRTCRRCLVSASSNFRRQARTTPQRHLAPRSHRHRVQHSISRVPRLFVRGLWHWCRRVWAEEATQQDPEFFSRWAETQKPQHLWIGCSDSRVAEASEATGLKVGDIFVHRNVGNVLLHADNNGMSALEYAVKVRRKLLRSLPRMSLSLHCTARMPLAGQLMRRPPLQVLGVKHVLVCGHTNCAAVKAALAMPASSTFLASYACWISQIRDIRNQHAHELVALPPAERVARLVELNVKKQVFNVCTSAVVQQMWKNGREVHVHGLQYDVHNGSLQRLDGPISGNDELPEAEGALEAFEADQVTTEWWSPTHDRDEQSESLHGVRSGCAEPAASGRAALCHENGSACARASQRQDVSRIRC